MPRWTLTVRSRVVDRAIRETEPTVSELDAQLSLADERLVSHVRAARHGASVQEQVARDRFAGRTGNERHSKVAIAREPRMREVQSESCLEPKLSVRRDVAERGGDARDDVEADRVTACHAEQTTLFVSNDCSRLKANLVGPVRGTIERRPRVMREALRLLGERRRPGDADVSASSSARSARSNRALWLRYNHPAFARDPAAALGSSTLSAGV
jgi:hypothetical protein